MAVPFLIAIPLSLLIPSKKSSAARRTRYYASAMAKIVYAHSILLIFIAVLLAILYLSKSDMFSSEYLMTNILVYSVAGIGLLVQGFLGVRLSRKSALSGKGREKEISFARVAEQKGESAEVEEEPVVFEFMEVEAIE